MMKTAFLLAGLSVVFWAGPTLADEVCVGPACISTGHRDREESREERREQRELREDRREQREEHQQRMWR
jgi:hypothetical protein